MMTREKLEEAALDEVGSFIKPPCIRLCGENMLKTKCDRKGRICLPAPLRARYGERFIVVETPEKLVLLPVPKDPVKDHRELGQKLKGYTIDELKRKIREQAEKEVGV